MSRVRHRIAIAAAGCFVMGSLAFYRDELVIFGTTLYLIGSCLFLANAVLDGRDS